MTDMRVIAFQQVLEKRVEIAKTKQEDKEAES